MTSCRYVLLTLLVVGCASAAPPPNEPAHGHGATGDGAPTPPMADVRPTSDRYHGEEVVDAYQWLEEWENPDVRAWSAGQNRYARHVLEGLGSRDAIRERVTEILSAPTRSHRHLSARGGKLFAIERRPPREQPMLVVMDSPDAPDEARILLDPQILSQDGHVAIDWYVPSHGGDLVAVSLSEGGSERGDVHVYDVASGERVHEVVPHVQNGTAGGDVAWLPDDSGFFYTRYLREGDTHANDDDFYQQLWFHALGTEAAEDRYELGRDLPRIAEIQLDLQVSTGRLLATVQKGDGGEFAMFLRERDGAWRQFSSFDDGAVQATFGARDDLYVISRHEHPRGRLLRLPVGRRMDLARAEEVIAEGPDSLVNDFWGGPTVWPMGGRLYALYQTGGPSELRVFDARGQALDPVEQPDVSAVRALAPMGDALLFRVESFVAPSTWMKVSAEGDVTPTALREASPVDVGGWEVRREMATSRDGTQVPVNILMPRGLTLDGSHPCIVSGYGGYGVNIQPRFNPMRAPYLDAGVVYAIANLRGGAEFGEEWHDAGRLVHKQNVFDDFAAAVNHMVERGYTSHERVGIIGGSNGGLLMGATMVQRPDIARVVVSFVGIYDMLRVELSANGAFNVTEFGTVQDAAHYRALRAYSPYHNVREGTAYPATLFLTGANDPRVEPWHSRKMTARLQAANGSEQPILLRTSDTSGHGLDTSLSEEIEESTDGLAFLFHHLGVTP